ncbi:MAG TPA: MDR family MFS transporter [Chthonomonadaceae bacterium]|nr:MDR family MFS transporter [Chthonomonadaceae bacterium]
MLAMLLTAMESTVVSTAMPTVIGELHGIRLYSWVFSAYLLTSTTTVPIYGKLADLYGRRPVFLTAMALFLVGSMLSGMAHSMPQLILFRGLQGLGAGGVLPITLTIIGDLYDIEQRAKVQVVFTSMWGTASLAGPVIGAVLTESFSWRWVFYVNMPFGLIASYLVGWYLHENRQRMETVRIDYPGCALMTGAIISVLSLLQARSMGSFLGLSALSVALIGGLIWQERRAPEPLLPLTLFKHPVIAASMVGNILIGVMLYAMDSFMPLFMQAVRGGNAHSGSIVLTPLILCWSLSAFLGAKTLVRIGFQPVAIFGVTCICVASFVLIFTNGVTPTPIIILTMALLGTGLGPASMAFLVSAQNAVGWKQRGVVTAASQFFRSIGGTLGVGALGAVLHAQMMARLMDHSMGSINPNDLLNAAARASMPPSALMSVRAALAGGLHTVFLLLGGVTLFCLLNIVRITRRPVQDLELDTEG